MAKDLVCAIDQYEKDGQTKKKYLKIGVILAGEHGEYALIDPTVDLAGVLFKQRLMNPQKAGSSVLASIFDNSQSHAETAHSQPAAQAPQPEPQQFNDDIPF